jgi:serine/threonine-protein kinase
MNTPSIDPTGKNSTDFNLNPRDQMLQPGDRVGHCRVIDLIAAGGMANVYKVWHEQLEVVRAIKILKPGYTDESKGRLEMEAKISANLRHPNIVDIYYMGYWNTIPYIEMEFIDGPSLKELLETRTRFSIPLAISIAHYLCIALKFAYNQDMTLYGKVYDRLIHRDIKPANILVSSKGVIKLADFGIARPSEVSIHTVGSKIMGTFAYLSPEQLSGEKLDQRSDIYALGAVFYEMISGVKTFPQKLLADLVQKKSKGYYTPIGSMGLTFPKPLIDIIEKCLQLDKNKRYSDIADLDDALMSVFKKQSHKDCDEILSSIQSEPNLSAVSITSPNPKSTKLLIPTIASMVILPLIVFFLIGGYRKNFINEKKNSKPSTFTVSASTDSMKTTPENKVDQIKPQTSKPHKQTHSQEGNQEPSPSRKPLPESPFDNGLSAFKSGNYADAVTYLSTASMNTKEIGKSYLAKTMLLESYIRLRQYENALELTQREPIESAHFYLLKGELCHQLKKTSEAIESVNKALSFEQIESSDISRLRLLKARTSEEFYNLKPNSENMKRMVDDWKAYQECCCDGIQQSRACQEAQENVSRFSF